MKLWIFLIFTLCIFVIGGMAGWLLKDADTIDTTAEWRSCQADLRKLTEAPLLDRAAPKKTKAAKR